MIVKTAYGCACTCECVRRVLDKDSVLCEFCKEDDHWDPLYEMNWAKSFAVAVLIIAAFILLMWLALGGTNYGP